MTKSDALKALLNKILPYDSQSESSMTWWLLGLVDAVGTNEHLLSVIEWVIQSSMKQTISAIETEKLLKAQSALQLIKDKSVEHVSEEDLADMLNNI